MMPFLIERFEFQATAGKYPKTLPDGVHPTLGHFLYGTAHYTNPHPLGTLMQVVPVSQIMSGTDYPYRSCVEHVELCCTDQQAVAAGPSAWLLRKANVFRMPEFEHPVQCVHGDGDLGRSATISARSQAVANHPFEAADVGLDQSTPVVA
jgi:hypothetical protein